MRPRIGLKNFPQEYTFYSVQSLALEGEAGAELVGSLVELLGIKRGTKTQGNTLAEEDVVGKGGNTVVVDLELYAELCQRLVPTSARGWGATNLGERDGVDAVLGGNLEADVVAGLGVPGSLGTSLNLAVDLVVVRSGENAQVVAGSDGSGVRGGLVADGSGVAGDGGLVDVVAGRGTSQEALVADDSVDVGLGALEEVEEGTGVEVGLLEGKVELGTLVGGLLGGGRGEEGEDTLSLQALGEAVSELDLGVEGGGGVPCLGKGEACATVEH